MENQPELRLARGGTAGSRPSGGDLRVVSLFKGRSEMGEGMGKGWRRIAATLAVGALLAVSVPARAATVLLFIDHVQGTDYVTPALTALGHTVTTATSWADFNTRLSTSPPQLAIGLSQDISGLDADLTIMTNYINAGGHVIFTDWNETASFATLFNASWTGNDNQSPANFTNPTLSAGITNPQPLNSGLGWGTWSMGLSAGAGGTSVCTFPTDSCAVLGNSGRTIILGFLSDTPQAADGVQLWENIIGLAGFGAPISTTPSAVPSLSEWALIGLGAMLLAAGGLVLRRRRI